MVGLAVQPTGNSTVEQTPERSLHLRTTIVVFVQHILFVENHFWTSFVKPFRDNVKMCFRVTSSSEVDLVPFFPPR